MRLFPQDAFLYNPQEPTGGTSTPAASAAPSPETQQPVAQPAATSSPAQPTTVTPTSAGADAGGPATGAVTAQPSWLDGFRQEGFSAPDEATARQQLLQAYRDAERLRPLSPALSAYQQHASKFHEWLNEQNKQQAKPANADWTSGLGWNPPPYDPNWRTQLTTDEQGNIVPAKGAPADLVHKYQAYQQFRTEQADKLLSNPGKYMEPYIRHIAQEIASQHAQQNVGQYREQQEANTFITQHSNWLFDRGQDGNVKTQAVINPQTGRYESQQVLSRWGQHFVGKLQEAAQSGMPPQMQQQYAMSAVQNAYMASPEYVQHLLSQNQQQTQQPTETPREAANGRFTRQANPAKPPSNGTGGNTTPSTPKVNRDNIADIALQKIRAANVQVN